MRLLLLVLPSLALATAALLPAAPAAAQSIPSPYRFIEKGQSAGVLLTYENAEPGRFDLGPRPGISVGARYSVEVSGPVGLDLQASAFPTTRNVINPARLEGDRVIDEAEMTLISAEARFRFTLTGRRSWNRLAPFVFLGAGIAFDIQGDQQEDQALQEADRFDFGTKFLGSAGAATRIFITDRIVGRVEAGLRLYQVDTPSGFLDTTRELDLGTVPEDEWVNSATLSLGISYLF